MKKLVLLRHAKAEADSATGSDFDRVLDARGRADAARMGEEIIRLGMGFDRQLSSTAKRALETAELAGLTPEPEPAIYEASTGDLLSIVHSSDLLATTMVMVGHNPGFERLASWLTGENVSMPTCTLTEIELPIERWEEAGGGSGRLALYLRARDRT